MKDLKLRQHGEWMPADVQTPISLYLGLVGENPGILLESAEVDGRLGRFSLMAWDFRLRLMPENGLLRLEIADKRLEPLKDCAGMPYLDGLRRVMQRLLIEPDPGLKGLPSLTRGLYGYFGYNTAGMLEPALAESILPERAEACLVLPGRVVLFDHLRHRCCFLSLDAGAHPQFMPIQENGRSAPEPVEPAARPGREAYMAAVAEAKRLITEGEGIQAVLSTRFSAPAREDGFRIYRRLRQANPSPFMFFMRFPEGVLLGSSPELMVRCEAGRLEVRPIAGTRPRGADEEKDAALAAELLADPKERAEHVMLVDLGRNDLGRIATPGSVSVKRFMQVERFSHVMHLTSYVEARLKDGLDAIEVIRSTFPAGTLSGAPKIWAMRTISELEGMDRGPYGGCIGWIGLDEGPVNLDTGITIRSMWIRDGMCNWQAGAGIVYDSDPEKEWQECNNKARVLAEVIRGREDGDVFADR